MSKVPFADPFQPELYHKWTVMVLPMAVMKSVSTLSREARDYMDRLAEILFQMDDEGWDTVKDLGCYGPVL